MARQNRMQTANSNPAERFLEWKSNEKKFAYWDKDGGDEGEGALVLVDLPLKILAIASYKSVTGFNSKYKGGGSKGTAIRSNEVKDLKDTIKVYYMDPDKTVIAEGSWNNIKDEVDGKGGKYTLSVYAMNPEGELINLKLSGAAVGSWFDFCKNKTDLFFDHWVEVKECKQGKQGSVTYNYPVFSWGEKIDRKAEKLAEIADEKIQGYEKSYFGGSGPANFDNPNDSAVEAYNKAKEEVTADPLDF